MDNLDLIKFADIHAAIDNPETAHLVIGLNKVVSSHTVVGLEVDVQETPDGVKLRITVAEGTVIARPVHMCFGLLQEAGIQKIDMDLDIGADTKIDVIAHCVFPNAVDVRHEMDARINVGPHAHYTYLERHIHSEAGGITVVPKARVELADGARFKTDFELMQGRVGLIDMDYETTCGPDSVMEMTAKIRGKGDDVIKIRETGHLIGERSRGVLTSRVAVKDNARAEVYNKLTATAAYARGHVDCKEIIQGNASANAVPIVEVSHPKAHITHEAALGSVDTKQLETLMSRGLNEDEASDLIVSGLLS
ncbi:MAG: SufD family Fe-S cluster assembly protein [Phycisphaerae bacterium]|nr:SufD family Fe-S cluster assembly protein [Phycisphaerae bacterium]